jgi:dTDP-4-amino-4,6-dideoxygalactose transaminase
VTQSQVKLNDFERMWAASGRAVLDSVETVGRNGWYILGPEVEAFERGLATFWQLPHAAGVASGLDAIEIGLRGCGSRPGDKVLLPPVSAFATVLAAVKAGLTPVFADCDRWGLLDLEIAERALEADPAIRFLVPVHLYGSVVDPAGLRHLRNRFGVRIVEDCAQSIGATLGGEPSGHAGDCAATSFYPTKNLGALGDGGALLSASAEFAARARSLRDYGQTAKYRHEEIGYNSRLDELQAAILRRAFLPSLPAWTGARRSIAARYLNGIDSPLVQPIGSPDAAGSCWHLFSAKVPAGRKAEFMSHLRALGIQSAEHYPVALPDQPAMSKVGYECVSDLASGRSLCARQVTLPCHPYLTDDEVGRVIDGCNSWERASR